MFRTSGPNKVKVPGKNMEMLRTACQQLLGKNEKEIQKLALETVEGHQRAIMGLMTIEEIYQDRQKFSEHVFETASSDLVNLGISVISYTLKNIHDDHGYLAALGAKREAEVKRDARIGEALAQQEARIKEALAEEARVRAKFENDAQIAHAKRDFEVQKALFEEEVNKQRAQADLAFKLQEAKTQQSIKEEQMNVEIVERSQQIILNEEEIKRREKELEATVKRAADAERYKMEKTAEATRQSMILNAQAEAEAKKLQGEAEAFAIEAKGKAEAEQMLKKANAWNQYKEAAMVEMLLDVLPKVAAEFSSPLAQYDQNVKMISTGDGEIGAAKLTEEVMRMMNTLPQMVTNMTGVDISKIAKPNV